MSSTKQKNILYITNIQMSSAKNIQYTLNISNLGISNFGFIEPSELMYLLSH